jgi:hypothetical protein
MTVYSTTLNTTPGDMFGRSETGITEGTMNEGRFVSTEDLALQGPTAIRHT